MPGLVACSGVEQVAAEPQLVVIDSFESWYRDSYSDLLSVMIVAAGDLGVANEVTDEAFARAYERWHRVGKMASPRGWTYRVAVNLLHRSRRRRGTEDRVFRRLGASDADLAPAPDFSIEVWDAIQGLPLRTRTAIALRYLGGLSDTEIAKTMKTSTGTVARQLHDGRQRL